MKRSTISRTLSFCWVKCGVKFIQLFLNSECAGYTFPIVPILSHVSFKDNELKGQLYLHLQT